jgi:hypothetical protein
MLAILHTLGMFIVDLFKSRRRLEAGLAGNVCRKVNSAIVAPRSRGQNDELGIGEF